MHNLPNHPHGRNTGMSAELKTKTRRKLGSKTAEKAVTSYDTAD
ncbi:replication initiation protein, partial [Acetobacter sp. DmW_125135]